MQSGKDDMSNDGLRVLDKRQDRLQFPFMVIRLMVDDQLFRFPFPFCPQGELVIVQAGPSPVCSPGIRILDFP